MCGLRSKKQTVGSIIYKSCVSFLALFFFVVFVSRMLASASLHQRLLRVFFLLDAIVQVTFLQMQCAWQWG
jgi:bacteriorhodopsin